MYSKLILAKDSEQPFESIEFKLHLQYFRATYRIDRFDLLLNY